MKIIRLIGSDSGNLDAMNFAISGIDGVHDAVVDYANASARRGKMRLARHRHDGDSKVTVTEGSVDAFVNLDDTAGEWAAAAIEFGHRAGGTNGKFVPGLYIISKATGFVR
jgi:hypothetical protein